MAIFQVKTFADIVEAVREELKVQSSDTVAINRIKRDINIVYLQEVVPYDHWQWLRKQVDLSHKAYFSTGTVTVTQGSTSITVTSAPTTSKAGFYFSIQGGIEVYKIKSHTASSTTMELEVPYTQATASAQTFRIWTDRLPLPNDCSETVTVSHDFNTTPCQSLGLQAFREHFAAFPKAERRPEYYTTTDYADPIPYSTIGSLPALSTRASNGLVKTLVFAADVSGLLREGDFIEVSGATNSTYNAQARVSSVSTTTITYTGTVPLVQSATADVSLVVKLKNNQTESERYRDLMVYPSMYQTDVMIHVDYIRDIQALEQDLDEPLMPIKDRSILVFGALIRAWTRHGDAEECARNSQLYDRKLMKMLGKLNDSTDFPQLMVSKTYMRSKRTSPRLSSLYKWWKF